MIKIFINFLGIIIVLLAVAGAFGPWLSVFLITFFPIPTVLIGGCIVKIYNTWVDVI